WRGPKAPAGRMTMPVPTKVGAGIVVGAKIGCDQCWKIVRASVTVIGWCGQERVHNVVMEPTPTSPKTRRTAVTIGGQLTTWRKLQGLTAQQVADRARIS